MVAPFSWDVLTSGLASPHAGPDLLNTPVTVAYSGKAGLVHFHAQCPPLLPSKTLNPNPTVLTLTLGDLPAAITPSRRHSCAEDFSLWVSARDQVELQLLSHTDAALGPLTEALASAKRHGRDLIPYDNAPLTSGVLDRLIAECTAHLLSYPDRAHMRALLGILTNAKAAWSDLLARRDEIEAADPLAPVLKWAREQQLPELSGSPKQVRWAQRIRYDAAKAGTASEVMLTSEGSSNVWIGLEQRGEVSTSGWLAMKHREDERLAWQRQCRRAFCDCACHW